MVVKPYFIFSFLSEVEEELGAQINRNETNVEIMDNSNMKYLLGMLMALYVAVATAIGNYG